MCRPEHAGTIRALCQERLPYCSPAEAVREIRRRQNMGITGSRYLRKYRCPFTGHEGCPTRCHWHVEGPLDLADLLRIAAAIRDLEPGRHVSDADRFCGGCTIPGERPVIDLTDGRWVRTVKVTAIEQRRALGRQLTESQRMYLRLIEAGHPDQCMYCGVALDDTNRTIDHRKPRCRGGRNEITNTGLACARCNCRKADMTEAEFRTLLAVPA